MVHLDHDQSFQDACFQTPFARWRHAPASRRRRWPVGKWAVDDWLIGLFFLCAMGYSSLASTLAALERTDPSGVSGMTAAIVKGLMLLLGLFGLVGTLRGPR